MLLDEAMPRWDRRNIHRIAADSSPSVLLAAVEDVSWREVPVFRALLTLRGLGRGALESDAPILDWFASNGFRQIGRTDDEMLVVATQALRRGPQRRTASSVDSFREDGEPGCIKIATNFRTADGFLITETRVLGTDAHARRLFAVYWLVIRAGSGLIRRFWLHAIRSRAHDSVAICNGRPGKTRTDWSCVEPVTASTPLEGVRSVASNSAQPWPSLPPQASEHEAAAGRPAPSSLVRAREQVTGVKR